MQASRLILIGVTAVALVACSPSYEPPAFQAAAIRADPQQLRAFVGDWYSGGGTLWATVSGEDTPAIQIRFSEGLLLQPATINGNDLVLYSKAGQHSYRWRFRSTGDGEAVLLGDYDDPSFMCCFC
jgi:hypothetical protein